MMASVFEKTGEGIIITDTNGTIQKVNPGFTAITGYAPKDAVGKSPRLLNSGRHDENFFKAMWKALIIHGEWCGEIWNRRLKNLCREEDTLARSGGDEFLFMLPRLKSGQQSVAFARRLLYSFSEPFSILKRQVFIGVSIGITLFPHDGEDGETQVKNSYIAMYGLRLREKTTTNCLPVR